MDLIKSCGSFKAEERGSKERKKDLNHERDSDTVAGFEDGESQMERNMGSLPGKRMASPGIWNATKDFDRT